jgi:diguanylate cyclase (GGDEF)-like protein
MIETTTRFRRRTDHEPGELVPLRALVVDDNDAYRAYIAALVNRYGFTVLACNDGEEALGILGEGNRTFDLLVVDCEMPRVGGLELIVRARDIERHADVFAVMLTGREDIETKLTALRLGYDDFVLKSSSELEIAAKLTAARRLVSRHRKLDAAVRELYGLATRDELTGLFNRRYFFAEAERLLAEGLVVNCVCFDLDDFKRINDTMGHLAGDRILRDIGALFLRRTRHEDMIARYGGDEFIMLVPQLPPDDIEQIAARIAKEIEQAQWTFGTETIQVGVTSGIACSSLLDRPTVRQLLSAGDRDLYKNKWLRKNPHQDPAVYEYDAERDAHVLEIGDFPSLEAFRVRRVE